MKRGVLTIGARVEEADLLALSGQHLLAVKLGRTSSRDYPLAEQFARRAHLHAEAPGGGHLAVFARTREQASAAAALLRIAGTWRGTLVFVAGEMLTGYRAYQAAETLECYLIGSALRDARAHCVVPAGYAGEGSLPCRRLQGRAFPAEIPSGARAEYLRGAAMREACAWCPLFDAGL